LTGPRTLPAERFSEVAALWEQVFGDDPAYIAEFLRLMRREDRICSLEEGRVISALFSLKGSYRHPENNLDLRYIYAAATAPEYRGKGLMADLLDYAEDLAREEGADGMILVPQEEGLFRYYGRFGYQPAFYQENCLVTRKNTCHNIKIDVTALLPEELCRIRSSVQRNGGYVPFLEGRESLIIKGLELSGGGGLFLRQNDRCGYALWDRMDGILRIRELTFEEEQSGIDAVLSYAGAEQGLLIRPTFDRTGTPYGMVKTFTAAADEAFSSGGGYMNLMLD